MNEGKTGQAEGQMWPEQEAVRAWMAEHAPGLKLEHGDLMKLIEAVTQERLRQQERADRFLKYLMEVAAAAGLTSHASSTAKAARTNLLSAIGEWRTSRAKSELREALAEYAHAAWSGWMHRVFTKSTAQPDGTVVMRADLSEVWRRQADTPYEKLPDKEKASDLDEADKILGIVGTVE
jgi:hypothetical protein